jgi:acetyltransferase-like isoleucine patch superfamily enzyme
MKISLKSVIYSGFIISKANKIEIGANSVIGHKATLDGRNGIYIGKYVNISSEVMIWTNQHDYNDPNFKIVGGKVVIEDYVWISTRAIILPGVKIGKGSVIAAGSVVTKTVEPFSIMAGVPAKKVGTRENNLGYNPADKFLPFI